jgi:hypothetical protein
MSLNMQREHQLENDMTLYHIHLVMARNKEFPEGNVHRGYDIHAPLDQEGHLDKTAWENRRHPRQWCGSGMASARNWAISSITRRSVGPLIMIPPMMTTMKPASDCQSRFQDRGIHLDP